MAEFKATFKETNFGFDAEFVNDNSEFEMEFNNINVVEVMTSDHSKLLNRDISDQHPITAITGLEDELSGKLESIPAMTNSDIENILKGFM